MMLLPVTGCHCRRTPASKRAVHAMHGPWHCNPRPTLRTAFSTVCCRAFGYQFSKSASVAENIEFLRGMLARLERWARRG